MAEKKGNKKLQFLAFGLCSLLAMAVCLIVLVVTVNSVDKSNSASARYDTQSKTALSGEKNELLQYVKALTQKTLNDPFIKCNTYTDISVDDASVIVCGTQGCESQADKDLLIYAKNKILPFVDGFYGEDFVGEFGIVCQAMPLVELSGDSVTDYRFSVGQADENGNPVYDSNSGELIDADSYYINLTIDPAAASDKLLSELFSLSDKQKVSAQLTDSLTSVCTLTDGNAVLTALEIKAKINRLTDEIEYISFVKRYSVSTLAQFSNELDVFGNKEITFDYTVEKRYEYSYASIRFSESSVSVEPGSEVSLSVNAVIEDDSEYTVSFESSDAQLATVDEMGYVKGLRQSDKPVTITVRLEYLGKIFEDSCLVYVGEVSQEG